jgi:secreted trypsin-like serine protease
MKRFNIILLCIPLVWGSPFQMSSFKSTPLKDIESRIINGEQAVLGQFPWQVAMYFDGNYMWFCSGSVISEEWILTAGHCVDGAQSVRIFAGLVKLDGNVGAVSESTAFFLHEGYNSETLENDIGLVRLSKLLSFDSTYWFHVL